MSGEDVNVREARIAETRAELETMTADDHFDAGYRRMAYAIEVPNAADATTTATLALAHFAAAQAILTRYPEGMSQPGAVAKDPAQCRWGEPWQL